MLALALSLLISSPPNVVIIFCDDLGYGDLSCQGEQRWRTPHLDAMAAEGVRFTDFCVSQPVCSASRASLLTGCYANRLSIHGALGPHAKHGLSSAETTLAEICKAQGYATAIHGKWHLGHLPPFLPTRHGFDEFSGIPYSNDMWPSHPEARKGTYPPLPFFENEEVVRVQPDQKLFTTGFTDRIMSFIRQSHAANMPFFAYLAHPMPHVPLFVSDAGDGQSGDGVLGDVIAEIDRGVGQILATLKELGIDENTLVMFTSDNGPWLSYGDHAGTTAGLREGKGTTFEGGIRVPCIVRWPGTVPAGRVSGVHWMTIDVLPTVAALMRSCLTKRTRSLREPLPRFTTTRAILKPCEKDDGNFTCRIPTARCTGSLKGEVERPAGIAGMQKFKRRCLILNPIPTSVRTSRLPTPKLCANFKRSQNTGEPDLGTGLLSGRGPKFAPRARSIRQPTNNTNKKPHPSHDGPSACWF
jgi:arylsulfatase A